MPRDWGEAERLTQGRLRGFRSIAVRIGEGFRGPIEAIMQLRQRLFQSIKETARAINARRKAMDEANFMKTQEEQKKLARKNYFYDVIHQTAVSGILIFCALGLPSRLPIKRMKKKRKCERVDAGMVKLGYDLHYFFTVQRPYRQEVLAREKQDLLDAAQEEQNA